MMHKWAFVHIWECVCMCVNDINRSTVFRCKPISGKSWNATILFFGKWKPSENGCFPSTAHSFICTLNSVDFLYIAQIIPRVFLPHSLTTVEEQRGRQLQTLKQCQSSVSTNTARTPTPSYLVQLEKKNIFFSFLSKKHHKSQFLT